MRIRFIRAGIISIVATVVLAVITLAIIGTSAFGDSADLSYRTLDYDVTATANGDLKVTQHIDVKMRERTDSDDNTVYTYVRTYARFADTDVPVGTVSLTGILQYDAAGDGRYILKLRDESDCRP